MTKSQLIEKGIRPIVTLIECSRETIGKDLFCELLRHPAPSLIKFSRLEPTGWNAQDRVLTVQCKSIGSLGSIVQCPAKIFSSIEIDGVNFGGSLSFNGARIEGRIEIKKCRFEGSLTFQDSAVTGQLRLLKVDVNNLLSLSDSRVSGDVKIHRTSAKSGMIATNAHFSRNMSIIDASTPELEFSGAQIDRNLSIRGTLRPVGEKLADRFTGRYLTVWGGLEVLECAIGRFSIPNSHLGAFSMLRADIKRTGDESHSLELTNSVINGHVKISDGVVDMPIKMNRIQAEGVIISNVAIGAPTIEEDREGLVYDISCEASELGWLVLRGLKMIDSKSVSVILSRANISGEMVVCDTLYPTLHIDSASFGEIRLLREVTCQARRNIVANDFDFNEIVVDAVDGSDRAQKFGNIVRGLFVVIGLFLGGIAGLYSSQQIELSHSPAVTDGGEALLSYWVGLSGILAGILVVGVAFLAAKYIQRREMVSLSEFISAVRGPGKLNQSDFPGAIFIRVEAWLRGRGRVSEADTVYLKRRELEYQRIWKESKRSQFDIWLWICFVCSAFFRHAIGYGARPLRVCFYFFALLSLTVVTFLPERSVTRASGGGESVDNVKECWDLSDSLALTLRCLYPLRRQTTNNDARPSQEYLINPLGIVSSRKPEERGKYVARNMSFFTYEHYAILISICAWIFIALIILTLSGIVKSRSSKS